jgi:hypothetical protein
MEVCQRKGARHKAQGTREKKARGYQERTGVDNQGRREKFMMMARRIG